MAGMVPGGRAGAKQGDKKRKALTPLEREASALRF